ncbi:Smr/MutS family protein [Qipengyuania vesicularis]|uniref:Smr/MutS family protein n=1 Tax=Qipengyuania vesicularis TaxID=2867232 RepID=UPI001C879431|nr:Smr/MutS family protein [Qipengyuania vesicularis]MBX7528499.1 Smr/MutS family protein [Qipengyuania vesicularis]
MSAPRGLSAEEAEAWEKVAATVKPMHTQPKAVRAIEKPEPIMPKKVAVKAHTPRPIARPSARPGTSAQNNLDGQWDRKLKSGAVQPDFTLDLHGHNLDEAYNRLISGVAQARAMGARTILLVTGKPRPVDPADRGSKRGAIRAKVLDWLAASSHHSAIAAVRRAHLRHGGDGALYIVLRRER